MNYRYLSAIIVFFLAFSAGAHEGDFRPIEFVKNAGQWDGDFLYKAATSNGDIFFEKAAFNIVLGHKDNIDKIRRHKAGHNNKETFYFHRYRMVFENANINAEVVHDKELPHYYNYFLGDDPQRWKTDLHPSIALDYKNIYKNIDLHVSSESGKMKYDFIVKPGGRIEDISITYDGIDEIKTQKGKLLLYTSVGVVEEMEPFAYQYIDGTRKEVKCKYTVRGNSVSYELPDGYEPSAPLIIDPTIVFATFSGSDYDNWGFTATYDAQGNFYAGGITSSNSGGTKFNYTTGAFDTTFGGGSNTTGSKYPCDMTIAKFSSNGAALLYATYLGGSDNEQPHSLVVDNSGNLVICGRAYSADYPTTGGVLDPTHNGGGDIVVSKLNATGNSLLASTFIGGSGDDVVNFNAEEFVAGGLKHNYGDDARSEVIVDNAGNIYIAGCTKSTNFPVTGNAYQATLAGGAGQDAVVIKINPSLTSLIWSTYLGGNSDDAAYVLALDNSQSQLYVAGGTMSNNFPSTAGTLWPNYNGGTDGFILRFENGGAYALQRGTFVGNGSYDQCYGIQVDGSNNVYVMGQTLGGSFPVTAGVYSVANSSQFVMKLDNSLSTNLASTVYGSGQSTVTNISPVAFLVDTCGNVYISGWGGDIYTSSGSTPPAGIGNTQNMPINGAAGPAAQATTDGKDFYFIVFSPNFQTLLYATYQGGTSNVPEHVDGGTSRFDKNGVVYQAICGGCGGSSNFPITGGVYSPKNQSDNCNLIALKIAFNLGSVDAHITVQPNTSVCLGEPFNFSSSLSSNATSFTWDFGDGNGSNAPNPTYTYATGGTFQVRLIAMNPNACKTSDTAFLTVRVDTNAINADFTVTQTDSCDPFLATVTNKSKASGSTTYTWLFGDGKTFNGSNPPVHEYDDTGTYTITLILHDPAACNPNDTMTKTISFNTLYVDAGFEGPPVICEKSGAQFNNRSTNALTFLWNFGDGQTSNDVNPNHVYDTVGVYTITMYAYNPATCNGVDSLTREVTVETTPIANFRHDPIIPVTNDPINFTNLSQRATSWVWDFGDNTFSALETPAPKFYRRTGTYRVCLQALNKVGCSDTICKYVDADVYPLADLPKAFSPNGDGKNDILYVRGAGIELVDLKIFNRWGELVFETKDVGIGWDGKFKGKEAPVEAYAYVMNVTFVDGTTFYKKGNVTLLR